MKRATPFGDLEILDAHAHFFSRRFFETLLSQSPALSREADPLSKIGELTGWTMPPADPAALGAIWQAELDRHQVAAALLIASVPGDEASVAAAVAAHPGRLAGAFMLDPTRPDAQQRARRAFDELGLRVVCLFPAMHHFSLAECEGARAVSALATERPGTAIFVHCGALSVGVRQQLGLPSRFDLRRSHPLELHPLAAEFTAARFIIPHFGAGLLRETLMVADLCPNVYLDTSSSNQWIKYDAGLADLSQVFRRALAVLGAERLLFGTDSSFFPRGWQTTILEAQLQALRDIGASAEQAQAICGGNLRRLLNLAPTP
jgi:predicted TIM-barrel fold metal-dependent hydrolase